MAKTIPNFGQIAKAARLGWKWISELRLFVRITIGYGEMHMVEIQPPTFIPDPNSPGAGTTEWRAQEGVVDLVPSLTKYINRAKHHTFYINDDGMEVTPVAAEIPAGEYKAGQVIEVKPIAGSTSDDTPAPEGEPGSHPEE